MKKKNLILAAAFVFACSSIFFSCDKEDEVLPAMTAENIQFSDCKNTKNATVGYEGESFEYVYETGNKIKLTHKNVYFNCCQTENNLQIETSLSGDSLIVNEFEKEPGICNCICPYDMECTLGPLATKTYWLIMKKQGTETFRIKVEFNKKLSGSLNL